MNKLVIGQFVKIWSGELCPKCHLAELEVGQNLSKYGAENFDQEGHLTELPIGQFVIYGAENFDQRGHLTELAFGQIVT